MIVVNFFAKRRFNFIDMMGISLASGSMLNEHAVFGWTVLAVTAAISLMLEKAASEP